MYSELDTYTAQRTLQLGTTLGFCSCYNLNWKGYMTMIYWNCASDTIMQVYTLAELDQEDYQYLEELIMNYNFYAELRSEGEEIYYE